MNTGNSTPEKNETEKSEAEKAAALIAKEVEKDLTWRFLGLEVARRTEILALAAFIISLSGAVWQVKSYLAGPVIRIFPSDQLTITNSTKLGRGYEGEPALVRLIAVMSYVNEGETGQNGTVRVEKINFTLEGRKYEHRWHQFVSADVQEGKLVVKRESEARPFGVTAGGSTSHETIFAPWEPDCLPNDRCDPRQNFLMWDRFITGVAKTKQIEIVTTAEVYSKGQVSASCMVSFRDWEIDVLRKEEWITVACRSKG